MTRGRGGLGKGPTVARRQSGIGGRRSAAGSQRYSRKSNEREPNEAILKGDIVGSLARRTNSITSSGIERRKRGSGTVYSGHRHEVDSIAGMDSLLISIAFPSHRHIHQHTLSKILSDRKSSPGRCLVENSNIRNVIQLFYYLSNTKILDVSLLVESKIKINLTQLLHTRSERNKSQSHAIKLKRETADT